MIQIIISPAKKMNICEEFPGTATTPVFAEQTDLLYQTLKQMSFEELQKLWKCSEKLALQNTKRLCEFTPADAVTPAVLAYEGIQYQYLAPGIFSDTQWDYVNRHLNILSGFYGVLCPSDAVIPYRLEMQTKLETENATDLYHFWNNQLYQALYCKFEKDSPKELINLASAEYSKAVLPYLTEDVHCVTCVFGEFVQGKVKVKATLAKINGAGRNGPLDGRTPDSDCRRSETVHRTWICFRRVSIFRDRICVPKKGYLPGRLGFSYSAFISRISPHAIIAPEFPEGWVVISSGCACMITALPITSSG